MPPPNAGAPNGAPGLGVALPNPLASLDDPNAEPIEPEEEALECSLCITEHDALIHIHEEHMCIHCGAFLLGGGASCLNPHCPSNMDAQYTWVEAIERTDPEINPDHPPIVIENVSHDIL